MKKDEFVNVISVSPPPPLRREIIRYAGGGKDEGELGRLINECLDEALPQLSYRLCYRVLEVDKLSSFALKSSDLSKNLSGCDYLIVFAATLGLDIDRLIMKYSKLSQPKALIMQAIGAERIEALCDEFCGRVEAEGLRLRPRFSPGYGDLAIELQKDIFSLLDPERKIGLTLSDSMLMIPTKSVTSFVGIKNGSDEQHFWQRENDRSII
ncbi:MAG: Vitamin B12 dependent methionine synthase activation subunit [Clostridia bacterium]|nr:Vitamin B12 dependent methionine synthase activation subunit [Clostridia bacterium]